MADCDYQIKGDNVVYSESEFKQLLSEGYLDRLMVENNLKIKGIKPDENLASSFKLLRAAVPKVQPTEITEAVTPESDVVQFQEPRRSGYGKTVVKKVESTTESGDKVVEYNNYAVDESGNEKSMGGGVETTIGELAESVEKDNVTFYDEDGNLKYNPNEKVTIYKTIEGKDVNGNKQVRVTISSNPMNEGDKTDFLTGNDVVTENTYRKDTSTKPTTPTETVTKTEEVVTPTTETKQTTKEAQVAKSLADTLRKAKLNLPKGTAMASLAPGFDKVWDATIETVAKAIEAGGVTAGNFRQSIEAGMKALKNSDTYKAITDPKQRAKISAQYKKALVDLVPQHYNFSTDDLRNAEFETFNQKLEESKGKKLSTKEFNALKSEAKKFVNDNLPADNYKKSEVQSYVRNNFDKAKTVEDIQKNLDKVNNIMATKEANIESEEAKQAERDRKSAAKRIKQKVNPKGKYMTVKSGDTKKSKISIDAQNKIDDMRSQGMFEDSYLNSLNKEDTDALEAQVDEILGIGKEERKTELKEKRAERKTDEATILQSLSEPDEIANSQSGINTLFANNRGAVVIIKDKNGNEVSMNKEDFDKYMKENPKADLTGSKFYKSKLKDMNKLKEKYTPGLFGIARKLAMGALRNLETYVPDLSKGSRKMRDWITDKVDAITFASLEKLEQAHKLKVEINKGLDEIFGSAGGFSNSNLILAQNSGIQSDAGTKNATELTIGEVLDFYNLVRSEFDGKEIDPKKVEKNRERVRVANQIDPDEVIRYVESNPQLKKACDFIADKYNKEYRPLFASTYETVSGFKMPDGYYYPEPASEIDPADVINLEASPKALSAMVPNLKLRKDYNGAFQVVDIRKKLDDYIDSMTHAKEFIPIVESMRPLFSDINRPRVLEKLGSVDKYNDLKQTLERIFSGKPAYQDQTGFDKDWGMIGNAAAVGALWFRFKAITQQASAFINYYPAGKIEGVDATDVMAAIVPVTKEQKQFFMDFYKRNPYLYERLKGSNVSIDAQALQDGIDKIANDYVRGLIDAGTFVGMFPIKAGDALSVATPVGGEGFAMAHFKKKFEENGGDYEAARKYAIQQWFKQTERTQQPSKDPTAISTASQSPTFRIVAPFLSAQLAATRKAVVALKNMRDWKNLNPKEKQQARTDLLYYSTVGNIPFLISSGAIFGLINAAQSIAGAEDDEEKRVAWNKLKILGANVMLDRVQADTQAFYILGKIGAEFLNKQRGRDFGDTNPTFQRMSNIAIALDGYVRGVFNDDWNDLTKEEQRNFFNRYRMNNYEVRKFEKLNEEEKQQYIKDHPLMKQEIAIHRLQEWNDKYASLTGAERMGEKEWNALLDALNIKNPKKLIEGIDAWFEGNADIVEALWNSTMGDEYFKWDAKNNENFIFKKFFGETGGEMLTPKETVIPQSIPERGGPVNMQKGGQSGGPIGGPR
jgi:hypothetical protein